MRIKMKCLKELFVSHLDTAKAMRNVLPGLGSKWGWEGWTTSALLFLQNIDVIYIQKGRDKGC